MLAESEQLLSKLASIIGSEVKDRLTESFEKMDDKFHDLEQKVSEEAVESKKPTAGLALTKMIGD